MTQPKIHLRLLFAQLAIASAGGALVSNAHGQGVITQYYHQSVTISATELQPGQPTQVEFTLQEVSGNDASWLQPMGTLLLPAPLVLASLPTGGSCQNIQTSASVGGKDLTFTTDPTAKNGSCTVTASIQWPQWAAALCGPGAKVTAVGPATPPDVNNNYPGKAAETFELSCSTPPSWLVGPPGPPGPPGDCCTAPKQSPGK